jgi:hypothetical protein
MTRRNYKRNNRRNRQRNNTPELPPFAQMLFGAIVGKGVDMIAKKMAEIAEEETPDIHAEGISNQDVTNINNGKATLSKLRIPADGSAVEYPIPDNLQFFFAEDGKLMVRQKTEHETAPDDKEGNPITYDDILKALFFKNKIYWAYKDGIDSDMASPSNYKDVDNCTSEAQVKRLIAFNKLQNIAKYLNNGWEPNFDDTLQEKFYIASTGWGEAESDSPIDLIKHYGVYSQVDEPVYPTSIYFKSSKVAHDAVLLMGKDSLNDLFSTDW